MFSGHSQKIPTMQSGFSFAPWVEWGLGWNGVGPSQGVGEIEVY
jgi:hypothetical protein